MTVRRMAFGTAGTAAIVALAVVMLGVPRRAFAYDGGSADSCFRADVKQAEPIPDSLVDVPTGFVDQINVFDMQMEASHYGQSLGYPGYDPHFDVSAPFVKGEIDISDVQFVFGRFGLVCQLLEQGSHQWSYGLNGTGGTYGSYSENVTVAGEVAAYPPDSYRMVLDSNSAHSQGREICESLTRNRTIINWDEVGPDVLPGLGPPMSSPYTLNAGGTYIIDDSQCYEEHVIAASAWYMWQNSVSPIVNRTVLADPIGNNDCFTLVNNPDWPDNVFENVPIAVELRAIR